MRVKTTPQFIADAKAVHGNRYRYDKVEYINSGIKVVITCLKHGNFEQRPGSHLKGSKCPRCADQEISIKLTLTTAEFVQKALSIHGKKYGYSRVHYVEAHSKVIITCPIHGDFEQVPGNHLQGRGCLHCSREQLNKSRSSTTTTFIQKARKVHGRKYKYGSVNYSNALTKLVITCPTHGDFIQLPSAHLNGQGCSKCNPPGYSKLAVRWIEGYAYRHRLKGVQHAENGGEYVLPGTKIRVDGYHARSNTVFEFHGDAFHGNPKKHSPRSKPHPYNTKTAQRLYKETKARERLIRKLGYKVVTMWESDYRVELKNT